MSETIQKTKDNGWMPYLRGAAGAPQPWSKRLTWTASLWALAIAVFGTLMWGIPAIESRLDQHSRAQLASAGIDASTLNLRWSFRDVSVHGELPDGVSADQLEAIMRTGFEDRNSFIANGIRDMEVFAKPATEVVDSEAIEALPAPVVDPVDTALLSGIADSLTVDVNMQRNTAIIEGVVESDQQRRTLVEAMLTTGIENIQDNLDVLDVYDESSDVKVDALAGMLRAANVDFVSQFSATLDTDGLDYRVNTSDKDNAAQIENAATVAIVDFNVSGQTTVAQVGVVDVSVNSNGTYLTLLGQVLTDEQHRRLTFAAREAAGDTSHVVDQVRVSEEVARIPGSDARVDGLAEIVAQFKPGVSGQINLSGSDLTVDAAVASDRLKATLQEVAASARGRGISVTESIVVEDNLISANSPAERLEEAITSMQGELDGLSLAVRENVVFNSGNAELTSSATETLEQVVDVLQRYPELRVEVEGHTDNVGRDLVNEDLSRDRAEAVRQYLIGQSVDAMRLVAVGYGSRMPLTSNDTSEGRKRNRRVHFNVPDQQPTE